MKPDKHHGEGGTFELDKSGERVRVGKEQKPHPEGDRSRDHEGKPRKEPAAKVEPALPAPQPAPWHEKPAAADPAPKNGRKGA